MPITAITPELAVTYGSYSVGGSSGIPIDGPLTIIESFESAVVKFAFVLHDYTVEATFATAVQAALAAFRKPRQNLTVTLGATTLKSYSHAATTNTGFNATPTITEDVTAWTGRSRRFVVEIVFGLPATNLSTNGRQSATVEVAYDASRRRNVTISGIYTASGSDEARTVYEAQIAAYASAVISALTGTFELVEESAGNPDTSTATDSSTAKGKTLEFRRVYREIIFSQAGANLDDSGIVDQQFRMTLLTPGPVYDASRLSGSVHMLQRVRVDYECAIDKSVTQALETKWTGTIRAWVVGQVQSRLGVGAIALMDESPSYDYDNNRIRATLELDALGFGTIVEATRNDTLATEEGLTLVPAWDGNPLAKYRYQGPRMATVTVVETVTSTRIESAGQPSPPAAGPFLNGRALGQHVGLKSFTSSVTIEKRGRLGFTITLYKLTKTTVWEYYDDPAVIPAAVVT